MLRPGKLALFCSTISQIGVNQLLIRDARGTGMCLEVVDHLAVKVDRDLLLELLGMAEDRQDN